MKKGISLIVLVITIIVMIIIAGAIIISLNSSNVIAQSNDAVKKSDEANANAILSVVYAEKLAAHYAANPTETYVPNDTDLGAIADYVEDQTNNDWTVEYATETVGETTTKVGYKVKYQHAITGSNAPAGN